MKGCLHLFTATSPNGHKCSIAAEELGLSYQAHKVDLAAGEQRQEAFLQINPAGRIPVLVDYDASPDPGGFVLPESGAILAYLAAEKDEAGGRLLPADPTRRAEALSWVFYQTGHMAPPTFIIVTGLLMGMPHTADAMKTAKADIRVVLQMLDARLARTGGWLAAGQYSIADIAFISSVLFTSGLLGIDLKSGHPHLASWLEQCLARPAVRKGLDIPEPHPCLPEDSTGTQKLVQAARHRLAQLGAQLGSA